MAEKRITPPKEFLQFPEIRKTLDAFGRAPLEKGATASVSFYSPRLCVMVRRKVDGRLVREFRPPQELEAANAVAKRLNADGVRKGVDFGGVRKEEFAALSVWRDYVRRKTAAGAPPRDLAEIIREAIEREETKDETPPFPQVADEFLTYKEKSGVWRGGDSYEIARSRLKRLEGVLTDDDGKPLTLGEITPAVLETAIPRAIQRLKNGVPAPKTLNHYGKLMKEIFAWWYAQANHARPAREQLTNPLALYAPVKAIFLEEPEILPVPAARALLADLWEHEKKALPAVLLQMFCGVRNAEIFRVKWKDLRRDGEARFLYLSKAITKTSMSRSVPVPANVEAWLAALAAAGVSQRPDDFLFPTGTERGRKKGVNLALDRAQARTGIKKPANAFRHTAVSAMCVLYDVFKAASYCGHNVRIQGEFYKAAMSKQEAKDYFGIMPPVSDGKAIAFSRDGAKGRSRDETGAGSPPSVENEETAARGDAAAI